VDVRWGGADGVGAAAEIEEGRWARLVARADRLATGAAARPYLAAGALLALNLALIAIFVPLGAVVFSDPAELFREVMPATWLSFAELAFVAAVAWAVHLRVTGPPRRGFDDFWGLSAMVFGFFAVAEILPIAHFLSDGLEAAGALAPAGFHDLDAFLLTVVFLAAGAALLRYAGDVLPYRGTLLLFAIGVLLGAASQALDSAFDPSSREFVAEEALKLAAEPFFIGGFLLALHRVLSRDQARPRGRESAQFASRNV
jgi:hypothetical protein